MPSCKETDFSAAGNAEQSEKNPNNRGNRKILFGDQMRCGLFEWEFLQAFVMYTSKKINVYTAPAHPA